MVDRIRAAVMASDASFVVMAYDAHAWKADER